MLGVSELNNKVFVLFSDSREIKVYGVHSFAQPSVITVEGLRDPRDIVACLDYHQLYIGDCDCFWRVSAKDAYPYEKWLPSESETEAFSVNTLSITSQRLLVTTESRSLRQYSTTNRQLLRVVQLHGYVKLDHAVETTRGTFVVSVVCDGETSQDKPQSAVSDILSIGLLVMIIIFTRTSGVQMQRKNRAMLRKFRSRSLHPDPVTYLGSYNVSGSHLVS